MGEARAQLFDEAVWPLGQRIGRFQPGTLAIVYRKQIPPMVIGGAEVMDSLFPRQQREPSRGYGGLEMMGVSSNRLMASGRSPGRSGQRDALESTVTGRS